MPDLKMLLNLSDSALNELYLGKPVVYDLSPGDQHKGKIVHVCYYSDMKPVPWAEVEFELWERASGEIRTGNVILPLNDLILIAESVAA